MERLPSESEFSKKWESFRDLYFNDIIHDIKDLVETETPSDSPELLEKGIGKIMEIIKFRTGNTPEVIISNDKKSLYCSFFNGEKGRRILLLCHYDTVWPAGTLKTMPFLLKDNIASGPGVFDMKSGIIMSIWAVKFLKEIGGSRNPVEILITPDEEIGSESSRALIEQIAKKSSAVIVMEAAIGESVKVGRKGVMDFTVDISGKAAHAGLDPDKGISAISDLVRIIPKIESCANPEMGTTVNVGLINGGSRTNVVAAFAQARVDVRITTMEEAKRVSACFDRISKEKYRSTVILTGGLNRPPMEKNKKTMDLFEEVSRIGSKFSFKLEGVEVGGASDGNFVSAAGLPVIDGMGAVGDGAHSLSERIDVTKTINRILLISSIINYL